LELHSIDFLDLSKLRRKKEAKDRKFIKNVYESIF
jgi:hypothetical protein